MIEAQSTWQPTQSLGKRIGQRLSSRVASACLMFVYGLAIFAPLLASDRPYILKAIDYRAYAAALRTLAPLAASVERLVELGEAGYVVQGLSWQAALATELEAAEQRVTLLCDLAPSSAGQAFHGLLGQLEAGVGQALDGELAAASETLRSAREGAHSLRQSHRALDPRQPEHSGLALRQTTSYPLFETLSGLELFFMLLWCALLLRGLWLPRATNQAQQAQGQGIPALVLARASQPRRHRLRILGALVVCAGLATLYGILWGGSPVFESASYKEALDKGELVAERVLFPPLAFGFAEGNRGEIHRPPTWTRGADGKALERKALGQDPASAGEPAHGGLQSPIEVRFAEPARNSAWRHPLGTDSHGRDLLVRLLWGARVSLSVGLIAAILVVLIGTTLGALAGYLGGRVDFWISRLIEVVQCFPAFFLILLVLAFWDLRQVPPIYVIVVVMALVRWTAVARLARAEFLRLRATPFAMAARAAGVSPGSTIFRHLLPNALGPLLVAGTFLVGSSILTESALSFLGFGVQEPIPSWGSLINDSRSAEHWWMQLFPGLMIFVTVVSYNLLGEALRDALDPKWNQR